MIDPVKELEEAIKGFEEAEAYFENAYLTYRLARKYLDEKENAIAAARLKIDPTTGEPWETQLD